jgi:hypothetical protein
MDKTSKYVARLLLPVAIDVAMVPFPVAVNAPCGVLEAYCHLSWIERQPMHNPDEPPTQHDVPDFSGRREVTSTASYTASTSFVVQQIVARLLKKG